MLSAFFVFSQFIQANDLVGPSPFVVTKEVTPEGVAITSGGGLIVSITGEVGSHGCTVNDSFLEISVAEQSSEMVALVVSVVQPAIAAESNVMVYLKGCLLNGRPKVVNVKPLTP